MEFGIIEGRGNISARDLTAIGGGPIIYHHENMKLHRTHRNRKLSQMSGGLSQRHTGVVVINHPTGDGGYIVPDRQNFETVRFRNSEIQSTGVQRIARLSEVEFNVRCEKQQDMSMDYAVCVCEYPS